MADYTLRCFTPNGGKAVIKLHDGESGFVQRDCDGLSDQEVKVYQDVLVAEPASGADMWRVKATLEAAGFETFWEGRAPSEGMKRFELKLPPDLHEYLLANGGSELVRRLLEDERKRRRNGE